MKFFIEQVTYFYNPYINPYLAPTIAICWKFDPSPNARIWVDYLPWTNYPYEQNLENFRPVSFFWGKSGPTLFKAPNAMSILDIMSHNAANYQPEPDDPTPKTCEFLVRNLEKSAEEICKISDYRYLYFMKKEEKRGFSLQEGESTPGVHDTEAKTEAPHHTPKSW